MLSRHFRAHNLNVSEMRLLFLCDARIQESLSEGVRGGGGEARLPKNNLNNVFLNPQLILQLYMGGPTFYRGGGSNISRGGGVQMLNSIKTHITCDFLEGVLTPCPPLDPRMFEQSLPLEVSKSIPESLSLRPLDVRKSIQSPRHCNSRLVKVSRVPVIATRGQ